MAKPTIHNLKREHLERLLGYTPSQAGKFTYNDLVYQYSQMPAFETDDYSGGIVGGFSPHELGALQATLNDFQNGVQVPTTPPTIALLGDSITEIVSKRAGIYDIDETSAAPNYNSRGYFTWANQALGKRLILVKNAGVSGQRTDQIRARVTEITGLARKPRYCFVMAGTNDITIPRTTAQITADLEAIYTALLDAGIVILAGTITPRASLTTQKSTILLEVNTWIRNKAATTPNIILIDWFADLVDSGTEPKAGMSYDGLHPTAAGAGVMGARFASVMGPYLGLTDRRLVSVDDPLNLLTNGLMGGTGGVKLGGATGELADNWATLWPVAGAATLSKVERADGLPGTWQQVEFTGGGFLALYQNIPNGQGWKPGDLVYGECEYETDAAGWDVTIFSLRVYGQGIPSPSGGYDGTVDTYEPQPQIPKGVLRTPLFTIPATASGALTFQFSVRSNSTGTYRFTRAAIKRSDPY